ncbi:hypothetical protein COU37_01280 [Candidatus Micrarchaeota archaeon CG10_big_fil_rev_8_21_14_0_10_45_29]|nr:MAG: hypothetical protein COU37_01280 [Candidatus Micrarchaeota archaeon CG10_big_fil_rev_8_21_14_0_10_45_29]
MLLKQKDLASGIKKDSPTLVYKFSRFNALTEYATKKTSDKGRVSDSDFRKMAAFLISNVSHQVKHLEGLSDDEIKAFKQLMFLPWENKCPRTIFDLGGPGDIDNAININYKKILLEKTSKIEKEKVKTFFMTFFEIMQQLDSNHHGLLDNDDPKHQTYQAFACVALVSARFMRIAITSTT